MSNEVESPRKAWKAPQLKQFEAKRAETGLPDQISDGIYSGPS